MICQTYDSRYSVSGSRDSRCSLDVTEVRQSDAGLFTCIEASEQSDRQTKYSAFLAVAGEQCNLFTYLFTITPLNITAKTKHAFDSVVSSTK